MLHLRPSFGHVFNRSGRIGDFFLHLVAPNMYRISRTTQDAQLATAATLPELTRISSDFPGDRAIVSDGTFFRISG